MFTTKKIRVAINGFGRIGRAFVRQAVEEKNIEIVAVNDLGSIDSLAYLLKYDTVYKRAPFPVEAKDGNLLINKKTVRFFSEKEPSALPWGELKVDVSMLKLLSHTIDVQKVVLTNVTTHIYRDAHDTDYNFSYIVHAFAGAPKQSPADSAQTGATAGKPWAITVGTVMLENIHARLNDAAGGTNLAVDLKELSLRVKKLDLDEMCFHVKKLSVDGLRCSYVQDTSYLPSKREDTGSADLHLVADDVELAHVDFHFNDKQNKFLFDLGLGKLELELKEFGLEDNTVDVDRLEIADTRAALVFGKMSRPSFPVDTIVHRDTTTGWNVHAGRVKLKNLAFKMDNESALRTPRGMDYAHLDIRELNLDLKNAMYNSDSLAGRLKDFSVKERSGLIVKDLHTDFNYGKHGATLDDLYLETPYTILQDYIEVHYDSLAALKEKVSGLQIKLNIEDSRVSMKDVLLFAPDLVKQPMFAANRDATLRLEAKTTGTVGDLRIKKMAASGLKGTDILLSGQIKGLPDPDKLFYETRHDITTENKRVCCYHRAAAMRGNEQVGSSLRFIIFVAGDTFLRLNPHSQQPENRCASF